MNVTRIKIKSDLPAPSQVLKRRENEVPLEYISLGRRGESGVRQIRFDFSAWVREFGAGTPQLLMKRPGDKEAHPVVTAVEGNELVLDVTESVTGRDGEGKVIIEYLSEGRVKKSKIYGTQVENDIGARSSTPPDPFRDWVDAVVQAGTAARTAADRAEAASVHEPKPLASGNWGTWDPSSVEYIDTGNPWRGEKGDKGDSILDGLTGQVGDILQVDAVDQNGVPTAWKLAKLPNYPVSMAITTPPDKVTYETGENFDTTGMVVTLTFSNGATEIVDNGKLEISPSQFTVAGNQNVTLTYRFSGYVLTAQQGVTVQTMILDSWAKIVLAVHRGIAPELLPVGQQVEDTWRTYTAPWDVAHYDEDGNLYLNWHYTFPDGMQFDAPEAIWYADANGLAAGTYYITIGSAYGTGWSTSKHIQFTLTGALAEGDQIYIDCGANNANDPTAGRTGRVYAKGSTVAKQTFTTSDGTDGTPLGTIGNISAHRANGQINAISRVVYGSGRWSESAIRQYLNSAATADNWWSAQNGWDRPPAQHTTVNGFLSGFSAEFLAVLEPVEVVTALNTAEGFAEPTETTMDRIFLPSLQEMNINPQLANVEGVDWDYNKTLAQEAGLPGKFQQGRTYEVLRKYNLSAQSSSVSAWLRSCGRDAANNTWYITSSGTVSASSTSNALRGCPACKIKRYANG